MNINSQGIQCISLRYLSSFKIYTNYRKIPKGNATNLWQKSEKTHIYGIFLSKLRNDLELQVFDLGNFQGYKIK